MIVTITTTHEPATDVGYLLHKHPDRNDRRYAASSMMSVALSKTFRTAMTGRCGARPELAAAAGAGDALPGRCRPGSSPDRPVGLADRGHTNPA